MLSEEHISSKVNVNNHKYNNSLSNNEINSAGMVSGSDTGTNLNSQLNVQKQDSPSEIRMLYDSNLKSDGIISVDKYGFVSKDKPEVIPTKERKYRKREAKRSLKWIYWAHHCKIV